MAAGARLSAVAAVVLAAVPVVFVPDVDGAGLIYIVGILAVAALTSGLIWGSRPLVYAGVAGLVLRIALSVLFSGVTEPPLWVQAGIIAGAIELSALSFVWRRWPIEPVVELSRIGTVVVGLMLATSVIEVLVAGVEVGGLAGRVAGVAGLLIAVGLAALLIKRRVEGSPS